MLLSSPARTGSEACCSAFSGKTAERPGTALPLLGSSGCPVLVTGPPALCVTFPCSFPASQGKPFFPCLLPSSFPSSLLPSLSCPFFGLHTLNARGSADSSTFNLHQAVAPGLRKFRGGKAKSACPPRSSCVWTWNRAQNSSCLLT